MKKTYMTPAALTVAAGIINNTTPKANTAHKKTAIILLNLLPDVINNPSPGVYKTMR